MDLGPVDLNCSFMVCDLERKDTPVIYVSKAFETLTGYTSKEVLGHNCRFLQAPGGKVKLLTIIPIRWDGDSYRYAVGFQVEK